MAPRKSRNPLSELQQNLQAEARTKAKAEEVALVSRLDETAKLAADRGEELEAFPQRRGECRKPMRRMSGLEWLYRKARIDAEQFAAGKRYGDAYRIARAEYSIRSILNDDISGGEGPTVEQIVERANRCIRAKQRLGMYRNQLMGEVTIISACDFVCGEEKTPREASQNGRDAVAIEALVIAGLGLLVLHLAPAPAEIGESAQNVEKAA